MMHATKHRAFSAVLSAAIILFASGEPASGDGAMSYDGILTRTTFGTAGLIEMPSAEMAPDGQLSATLAFFQNTQRYNLGFQALPWLEVSFRYAAISYPNDKTYYDRSYGLKLRLFQEGEYLPAIVVGAQDLKGTGIYAGEYVAASRHVFNDFDITAGIGWGRLGSAATLANPLAQIFPSFKTRSSLDGEVDVGQLFHGPDIGVFGGVVWQTPIENLALSAEYSSDRYVQEAAGDAFKPRSPVNFGLSYQPFKFVQIGLDWLYGRTVAANLTLALDPATDLFSHDTSPPPPVIAVRSVNQRTDALEALLDREGRGTKLAMNSKAAGTSRRFGRSGDIGYFVDRMMTAKSGIRNIALEGTTVLVIVEAAKFDTEDCLAIADLAAGLHGGLTRVDLIAAHHRYPIACAVPKSAEAKFLAANYVGDEDSGEPGYRSQIVARGAIETDDASTIATNEAGTVEKQIRRDSARQSLRVEAVQMGSSRVVVHYANSHYRSEADAVARLIRILMSDAPPEIEYFKLVSLYDGTPFQQFTISRSAVERLFAQGASITEAPGAISVSRPELDDAALAEQRASSYPRFDWSVVPSLRENYFASDTPTEGSFSIGVSGRIEVSPGVSFTGEVDGNLWNDFNARRINDSSLPHVRSDYPQYLRHGAEGIGQFYGAYHFGIAPGVMAVAKGGYLESMFGGVGGEVLWQPESSRFAFGIDAYEVWQRNFDRLFGFMPYHTFTGHIAAYYRSPWFGLNAKVLAGQYLAGDHGATFEITRRFSTGVEIGAFATLTDVSHQRFGQGSFDKGIMIRIPLEWALPVSTQSQFDLDLKPVLRDGGQRLEGDTTLYNDTQRMSLGEFNADLDDLISP